GAMSRRSRREGPLANAFQIYAPSLVYATGVGAIMPAIATASTRFGVSVALAASTVTLIGVGSLIANAPAAQLASRAGERTTMIIAASVGTGGVLLAWAMDTPGTHRSGNDHGGDHCRFGGYRGCPIGLGDGSWMVP